MKSRARSARRSAEIEAARVGSLMKLDDILAAVVELRDDRVRVGVELGDRLVLLAEDVEHLLSGRRAGAPRRIAALRFSALPVSAVPNSLISSCSRCL